MLHRNWIYDTTLTPSIFDEDNVEGLCGNPNNNTSDDFVPRGNPRSKVDTANFQKRWRYNISAV